jgi:uncharacterized protein (DUF697 family)
MAHPGTAIDIPASESTIAEAASRCRRMVTQRAVWSAGVSAVPLPMLDIATDIGLFKKLIEDINAEFGLTPQQIGRLQPRLRQLAYQAVASVGGAMAGKLVTRRMLAMLLKRTAKKQVTRQITKYVPVAGQVVAAAVGFAAFRAIGNHHVDACVSVAREVMAKRAAAGA